MRVPAHLPRVALAVMIAAIGVPASLGAAPLDLAQYPAGSAYKAPVPNVILSVDTSGSMDSCDVSKCSDDKKRIAYVKQGLKATLIDSTKYEDQFRLSWQSFACDGIPTSAGNCNNKNGMAKFSGDHKKDFATWVTALSTNGTTPSQKLVYSSGEYLKKTGVDSPWNATPGVADASPLACRRAYHIFLSDGGWNFTYDGIDGSKFKTAMTLSNASQRIPMQNADGVKTVLPDGVEYSVLGSNLQTQIYRDTYGTETRITKDRNGNKTGEFAYPTLADMAFNYWSTDLQPTDIANELTAKIRQSGSEKFTNKTQSVTFDEYWNPRNDPAKWQHLVQYTIGYGNSAGNLAANTTTSPQFTGGTFGMYDVGFASLAVGNTKWDNVTGSDSNYDDLRPQELWHMAINSRGKFYPVTEGDLSKVFADIFDDIIVDTTKPISGTTSVSRSVSRVGTNAFQTNYIASDNLNSLDNSWYGYVTSQAIDTDGVSTPNKDWGLVNDREVSTADKLDALSANDILNRLVISYDIRSAKTSKGISFKWDNFSESTTGAVSAKMWLNKGQADKTSNLAGDGKGQDRLNFIRGDRSKEKRNTGGTLRNRKSRQGDIVNSGIWYTGAPSSGYAAASYQKFAKDYRNRRPMLYMGGNDGMLHGFSAEDGSEKIAYVPHGVIQKLSKLTDPAYEHQYYVDGSSFTGDVDIGTTNPDWRTYLAGTLGAGGRGYFVLDVTQSGQAKGNATPTVGNNFTEANAANLVVLDKTAAAAIDALPPSKPEDPNAHEDIGHILGNPVVSESNQQNALHITRTNNNRWALILGNGYNSVTERPVLLIQYLDGVDKTVKMIPAAAKGTDNAKSNGLSTPQFLDVNGDGVPDYVYAGDLLGNMWKFDISSASDSNWGVAFGGNALFSATYSAAAGNSSPQPITAPPVLRPNREIGGLMVAFGTGQNLTEAHRGDRAVQSVYSIYDNTRYTIVASGTDKGKVAIASSPTPGAAGTRSSLLAKTVDAGSKNAGTGISEGRDFWKFIDTDAVKYVCKASDTGCVPQKGWYLDLPAPGERVTTTLDFYDGSNILEIISEVPASGSATASGLEVCAPTPQSAQPFRTLINIASGKPTSVPVMNTGGGYVPENVNYARMTASSKELRISTKTEQVRKGSDGKTDKLARLPEVLIRPSWRQLK